MEKLCIRFPIHFLTLHSILCSPLICLSENACQTSFLSVSGEWSVKLPITFLRLAQWRISEHKTVNTPQKLMRGRKLNYSLNQPLSQTHVRQSCFFFVIWFVGRFGHAVGQTHSLPSFGLCVGLCGLAMCVAVVHRLFFLHHH